MTFSCIAKDNSTTDVVTDVTNTVAADVTLMSTKVYKKNISLF